jgi:hypothetical protein
MPSGFWPLRRSIAVKAGTAAIDYFQELEVAKIRIRSIRAHVTQAFAYEGRIVVFVAVGLITYVNHYQKISSLGIIILYHPSSPLAVCGSSRLSVPQKSLSNVVAKLTAEHRAADLVGP